MPNLSLSTVAVFVAAMSGCIIITVDEDRHFGPDACCPNECVNPGSESCYHEAGSCGRIDDDIDSDGDDLNDAIETSLGTDPFNSDTDGDGHCDSDEDDCGSDPLDSTSQCQG